MGLRVVERPVVWHANKKKILSSLKKRASNLFRNKSWSILFVVCCCAEKFRKASTKCMYISCPCHFLSKSENTSNCSWETAVEGALLLAWGGGSMSQALGYTGDYYWKKYLPQEFFKLIKVLVDILILKLFYFILTQRKTKSSHK